MAKTIKIPIAQISYPVKNYEQNRLNELKASIKEQGLLHPITVYSTGEDIYNLITGGKRLEACRLLDMTEIRCLVLEGQPSEDRIIEIKINENLCRLNLPWYEEVELRLQLHELRQKQHGVGAVGRGKSGWSLRDTAEELDMALGQLSEDLRMAKAVVADPKLKNIQDKQTAWRIINEGIKRERAETEAGLAVKVNENQVYLGDSLDILKYFPDNTFNAVITDPPWSRYYRDEKLVSDESTLLVFKEVFRVMRWDSFLYMFVSTADFRMYQDELPKLGFKTQEMPIIWHKLNHLTHGKRTWEYARDHEPVLVAVKGTPALTSSMLSSVLSFKVVPSVSLIHPNEKPGELIKTIMEHCSYQGSLILDPFGGSGIVAAVAKSTGRKYVVVERDKRYYDGILRRLENSNSE